MIAVYHGTVIPEKKELYRVSKHKQYYSYQDFLQYDFTLLGDIHKACYIDKENKMGYASSVVQMNFGEDENEHGMLVWDLETKKSERVYIKNPYCYKNIYILKEGIVKPKFESHVKYLSLRLIYYSNASIVRRKKVEEWIKSNIEVRGYKIIYQTFQIKYNNKMKEIEENEIGIIDEDDSLEKTKEKIENEKKEIETKHNVYIDNHTFQEDLEYYIHETKKEYTKEEISEFIKIYEEEYIKIKKEKDDDMMEGIDKNRNKWYIERFQFSNLLSYGKYNNIDLTNISNENMDDEGNIIGIHGRNTYGKSSIYDGICFVLFGTTPRGFNMDILRRGTKKGYFEVEIVINNTERYKIIRTISMHNKKKKEEKKKKKEQEIITNDIDLNVDSHVELYIKDMNTNTWLPYLSNQKDIKTQILKKIGTYQNFLNHSIFLQNSIDSVITLKGVDMYEYMFNVFELDIYRKIEKNQSKSKYDCKLYKNKLNELNIQLDKKKIKNYDELCKTSEYEYMNLEKKKEDEIYILNEKKNEIEKMESIENKYMKKLLIDKKYNGVNEKNMMYQKDMEIRLYKYKMELNDIHNKIENYNKREKEWVEQMNKIKRENKEWEEKVEFMDNKKKEMYEKIIETIGESIDIMKKGILYEIVEDNKQKIIEYIEKEYVEKNKRRIEKMNEIENEKEKKNEYENKKKEYMNLIKKMEEDIKKIENEKMEETDENMEDNINNIRIQIKKNRDDIRIIELNVIKMESKMEKLKEEIKYYTLELDEIKHMENEKKECEMMLNISEKFYELINMKNGIPVYRLKQYIEILENKMNMNINIFGDYAYKIFVEDKSIEMKITKNENKDDLTSYYPIKNSSGFEKFFISLLLKALIRDMSNIPQSQVLFIDETISNLDKEHLSELEQYIRQFSDKYYHDIFIITHLEEPMEWIENHIKIYRNEDDKISKVLYGDNNISMNHYTFMDDYEEVKIKTIEEQKDMINEKGIESSINILNKLKSMIDGKQEVPKEKESEPFILTISDQKATKKKGPKGPKK
jgi:DNA repair exonuclease SbcCD ATPase subunit